ncbi:MAG: ABC transporter permease [Pyrinomonadaceae bacterium]
MENLSQDVRYGARMLRRNPGFTIIAALSLAIGIGANTTIFSVVNALLLRPLPVANPSRLVNVHSISPDGSSFHSFSYPNYVDYREQSAKVFDGLLAYTGEPLSLSANGQSERIFGELVSGNFFDVLGVRPALGRFFVAEEDRTPDTHPVVVLGYGFWQKRFGGDASLVGKTLLLNGHQFTVIGIAPKKFTGTRVAVTPDVYVPAMMQHTARPGMDLLGNRRSGSFEITGRLKEGATLEGAQSLMSGVAAQLEAAYPEANRGKRVEVLPTTPVPGQIRGAIIGFMGVLMIVVGLVLLIACANVASLLLARATARRKEMAIRLAMGAGRGRIVRQLLTESVMLFLIGGAGGLLIAVWLMDVLLSFKPPSPVPLELNLNLDWRVLGFTLLASLVTGVCFGLAPALQSSRPDVLPALKDEVAGWNYRRSRLLNIFVVGQIALALLLLVTTGLFLRSLQNARTIDPGFNPNNVEIASLDVQLQGYDEAKGKRFYDELMERVRALPDVRAASMALMVPLGDSNSQTGIGVEGFEPPPGSRSFMVDFNTIAPKYFETLNIPLVRGRDFNDADKKESSRVAVVNEAMAARFWPNQDAVGKRFYLGEISEGGKPIEIVGVAKTGKYRTLGEDARMYVYLPFAQSYSPRMTLHLRRSDSAASQSLIPAVRREVEAMDKSLPLLDAQPLAQYTALSLLPIRIAATVAGGFGVIGLLLAAVGIFGVVSYSVTQRTREIGIRMALGAQTSDVFKLVIGQGVKLALVGVGCGLLVAVLATRLLAGLLYGVSATDPLTLAGVSLLLLAVAVCASYIPARRAVKVDPTEALRYE